MPRALTTRAVRPERLFRAMADPTRLAILSLLASRDAGANGAGTGASCASGLGAGAAERGERCVCELVERLRVPQPTASRHLAYLRRAGLVKARKQGPWSYYRLTAPRSPLHRRLLECLACCGANGANGAGGNGRCC
jgi:ArsR family transcriptional regulator